MNATYCLVCKKLTDNTNSHTVKNKGRLMKILLKRLILIH